MLALKHKLRVHESIKTSDSHDEIAAAMLAKWEFEDELQAIEEVLSKFRQDTVSEIKNSLIEKGKASHFLDEHIA